MNRTDLASNIMSFLETIETRNGEDYQANIAFFAVEIDDGTTLDYVTGFAGENRRWVQDAFLDLLPEMVDEGHHAPISEDEEE